MYTIWFGAILDIMNYYEVAPTSIIRAGSDTFTYVSEDSLAVGTMVVIPIGKKRLPGVIMQRVKKPTYDVKPIESTIESYPIPMALLQTVTWMSDHYHTPLAVTLQAALPRGITKNRRTTTKITPVYTRNRTKNVFTKEQVTAIDSIANARSGTLLLHGVTGAGKTLVYIESIRKTVASGRSAIVLVPEIALTSQLVAEFSLHFDNILLTHSRQTEAERHVVWRQALEADTPQIIIGPRSALFMPVKDIGLIVIDECHEPSFKQEQSPRYSALRTASVLAKHHAAKVVLGSATPNISDYYLADQSGGTIITMTSPARADTASPSIELVDMTKRDNFTRHPFLSNKLLETLESTFEKGEQALIFHNRRGTASTTLCENCGWQSGCPRCYVPLTLHADNHRLRCHICSLEAPVPTSCPSCHRADIIHKGLGTKRIEDELRRLFPKQTIARFDGDTATQGSVDKRYQELYDGSIDLIIGTQVIAKGLDLPYLRTVGVVQADAGLSLPDFAAPERTFQLLAQVIGRVGRSHHSTNVIVQSYQPDHTAIVDGLSRNYKDFYTRTLALRKHTYFPPFCHLLKLTCTYKTEKSAVQNARKLAETLRQHVPAHVEILGPAPAFYERVRDTYRWQLTIKSSSRQDLLGLLDHVPATYWQFELDPTSLL